MKFRNMAAVFAVVLVLVLASAAPTSGQTLQLAGGALEIRETLVYNSGRSTVFAVPTGSPIPHATG